MSRYNAAEAFKIGFYCEQRTGFHLHEDLCHVRIAGADGATAGPGEVGRIVISNLVNRASVLLNYPIGDLGAIAAEPCPCGRTLQGPLGAGGQGGGHPAAAGRAIRPSARRLAGLPR